MILPSEETYYLRQQRRRALFEIDNPTNMIPHSSSRNHSDVDDNDNDDYSPSSSLSSSVSPSISATTAPPQELDDWSNQTIGEVGFPDAQRFSTGSGNHKQTTLVIFVLFIIFSVVTISMRAYICRQQLRQRREAERRRSKWELRRQKQIENSIIVKTIVSSSTTNEGEDGQDVPDIENPPAPAAGGGGDGSSSWSEERKNTIILHTLLGESQTCTICLGDYVDQDEVCLSRNPDCTHFFHTTCGTAWLAKHSECPICRAKFLVRPNKKDRRCGCDQEDDDDKDSNDDSSSSDNNDVGSATLSSRESSSEIESNSNSEENAVAPSDDGGAGGEDEINEHPTTTTTS